MTTVARPVPRPAPAAHVGGRPVPQRPVPKAPPHAAKTDAAHHAHGSAHHAKAPNYLLIFAAVSVVLVTAAVAIWGGGSARVMPLFGGGAGPAQPARDPNTTMMYRDLKNGRLMVMEIGPNGAKMKGTIDKETLPLANEEAGKPQTTRRPSELTTYDRVQALGSAFR